MRIGSGSLTTSSNAIAYVSAGGNAAMVGDTATTTVPIPDGFEISGSTVVGVSMNGNLTTNVVDLMVIGYEY